MAASTIVGSFEVARAVVPSVSRQLGRRDNVRSPISDSCAVRVDRIRKPFRSRFWVHRRQAPLRRPAADVLECPGRWGLRAPAKPPAGSSAGVHDGRSRAPCRVGGWRRHMVAAETSDSADRRCGDTDDRGPSHSLRPPDHHVRRGVDAGASAAASSGSGVVRPGIGTSQEVPAARARSACGPPDARSTARSRRSLTAPSD